MPLGKMLMMFLLGFAGLVDGFLLFAQPPWFNPFVGMLFAVTLPFAGAMTAVFGQPRQTSIAPAGPTA